MLLVVRTVALVASALGYSILFGFVALFVWIYVDDAPEPTNETSANLDDGWRVESVDLPGWVGGLYVAGLVAVIWLVGFRLAWRGTRGTRH